MSSENQDSTARELTKRFEAAMSKRKERWTAQEDQKLAEAVAIHGAKIWTSIASKAGLNRSAKSCRLRWMNFLSPKIKRGNISDQEEDLIIRLHKLLGNRWSLIAGRLPGRTDMEIKNYWNTRLSKKIDKQSSNAANSTRQISTVDKKPSLQDDDQNVHVEMKQEYSPIEAGTSALLIKKEVMIDQEDYCNTNIDVDGFFDFSNEAPLSLEIPQIPYTR